MAELQTQIKNAKVVLALMKFNGTIILLHKLTKTLKETTIYK